MREKLIRWLFKYSEKIYIKFKNNKSWDMSSKELFEFPKKTLGNKLALFLNKNELELSPKTEQYYAYHVLTGYGTKIEDKIALQCLCFGNGKRSCYAVGLILLGTLILPEHIKYYIKSYKLGKDSNPFYHFNYKNLLNHSLHELREIIFNKEQLLIIN